MDSRRAVPFTQTFRVRYEECGPGGDARPAAYLRYLQELAFAHSAALGYPLAWYEANRLFWLVRHIQLTVFAPARYGDALLCGTQVVGMRRMMARRHNTVRRDDVAVATSDVDWILTREGRSPTNVPEAFAAAFPTLGGILGRAALREAHAPPTEEWTALRIRASDADAMGHANHTVYLDLLEDAVIRGGGGDAVAAYPRTYELQYAAAAPSGARLRDLAWPESDGWQYRLESPDGRLYLHGRLSPGGVPGAAAAPGPP